MFSSRSTGLEKSNFYASPSTFIPIYRIPENVYKVSLKIQPLVAGKNLKRDIAIHLSVKAISFLLGS